MRTKRTHFKGLSDRHAVFVIEYLKDFSARRAAEVAGYGGDHGYKLIEQPDIRAVIDEFITRRAEETGFDAEWLLYELVDNHRLARQMGNIPASNTALLSIAKHVMVDALAKQKMELDVVGDKELIERLLRGRKRAAGTGDAEEVSFL